MFILSFTQRGTPSLEKESSSRLQSSPNPWSKKLHLLFSQSASSHLQEASPPSFRSKTSNPSGRKAHKSLDSFAAELVRK